MNPDESGQRCAACARCEARQAAAVAELAEARAQIGRLRNQLKFLEGDTPAATLIKLTDGAFALGLVCGLAALVLGVLWLIGRLAVAIGGVL